MDFARSMRGGWDRFELIPGAALVCTCLVLATALAPEPCRAAELAAEPDASALAPAAAPSVPSSRLLTVGRLTLQPCDHGAWCGRLPRALDPASPAAGTVAVYFEYYPHSGPGPVRGTLVATEGGPGYGATGSRDEYLSLYAPLRTDHDVLIMDNRGTGHSGALDCPRLQNAPTLTEGDIGECGRSLGSRAPLYSTALAADDLAALLEALAIGRIDLYGDSYGSYFAQVFALRHPQKLRSLVLDGADALSGPDFPWYPHYAPAMREKFNLACERDAQCRRLGGSSMDHIAPALRLLRERPFRAEVRYGHGAVMPLTADASRLAIVMFGGSPAYATVRELDAAARAFAGGDRPPLLRLMAETLASVESRDATHSPVYFSAGLAALVSCEDPPQIFDMSLPVSARLAARDRAIARRKKEAPDTYAPFTIDEYRRMPLDYAFIDQCVEWPAPLPGSAAPPLIAPVGAYPDIPVLVVSGELDNMTPVADGAEVAGYFRRSHHVIIANSFHVNAKPHARSDCATMIVRRFLADLTAGDERCAAAVPAISLVPRFVRHVSELDPAEPRDDNQASDAGLRAASAALLTCADVITRAMENGAGPGVGLRGGSFTAVSVAEGYRLTLREVQWSGDLAVSGDIDWPGRSGTVRAHLILRGPGTLRGALELEWPEGAAAARAEVRGKLGGRTVLATAPAP
jgi:pimeloyl-ACP methyl ester carboxylesterase